MLLLLKFPFPAIYVFEGRPNLVIAVSLSDSAHPNTTTKAECIVQIFAVL
jgi:hypothetical protein